MIKKVNNLINTKFICVTVAIASLTLFVFYLFYCSKANFHSDTATQLLIASEQLRTGKLFPEGWHNTTGQFVTIWELMIVPFMAVIPDWILCKDIVVFIKLVILILTILSLIRCINKNWIMPTALCLIFMCFPSMGHVAGIIHEAAYTGMIIYNLSTILLIMKLFTGPSNKAFCCCLLGIIIFLSGYTSIRNYAISILPAILSIILYYRIEYKETYISEFKYQKGHVYIGFLCLSCVIAFTGYLGMNNIYPLNSVTSNVAFTRQITDNLYQLLESILSFYNASGDCPLFSYGGIQICCNFVFMIITAFVVPIYFLVNYKKLQNQFIKMYTLYAWISDFIVIYMMIFSTANVSRYYISVFFHNIIFLALLLEYYRTKIKKDIKILILFFLLCLTGINHLTYFSYVVKPIRNQYKTEQETGTLVDFLQSQNLKYGVASYWNAYNNMCKSNGDLVITACYSENAQIYPEQKFLWGTSEYYYNPANFKGKSFLLLKDEQTVSDLYYKLASETQTFQQYTILIFEDNIYSYDISNSQNIP